MHSPTSTRTTTTFLSRVRFSSWLLRISTSREYFIVLITEMILLTMLDTSETKQKTLEEIASAFGDKVISPDERSKDGDRDGDEDGGGKTGSQHVEAVSVRKSG